MTHSLTKNHLVINFLLLFFLLALTVKVESADRTSATNVKKRPSAEYEYQLKFDARYGNHYYGNSNVATHRHTIEYEQKAEFNNIWSAVLGGRAETEAAR